jgi:hypothetical protein
MVLCNYYPTCHVDVCAFEAWQVCIQFIFISSTLHQVHFSLNHPDLLYACLIIISHLFFLPFAGLAALCHHPAGIIPFLYLAVYC